MPVAPRPCADPDCRGRHAPAERVALAIALCGERGVQLTKLRRQILELLWESGRPTGAYDLIAALKRRDARPIGPPTVYRALEFLIAQGLASKIESRNAYVACTHPERGQESLFFICSSCGTSVELEDQRLVHLISEDAARMGFRPTRRVVEVEGTCARCAASDAT
ncbi:MAG: Fur family transcriptional regulator [Pseudomonadota bacterium]